MSSIATKRGDGGQTGLAGGVRVSKSSVRVEAYGTVDELNAAMGLARALCQDEDLRTRTATIQKELFRVGSALATPVESAQAPVPVTPELVDALTEQVHQIESIEGVLSDWSISGEHAAAAAYDVARTVCRRAERNVVRLAESGEAVNPNVLAYLNRLSDLLWLFGRKLEFDAGVSGSLRAPTASPALAGPALGNSLGELITRDLIKRDAPMSTISVNSSLHRILITRCSSPCEPSFLRYC